MDLAVQELVGPAVERMLARRGYGRELGSFIERAAEPSHDDLMYDLVRNFNPAWADSFNQVNKIVRHPKTGAPQAVVRVDGLSYAPLTDMGHDGEVAVQQARETDLRMKERTRVRRGADRKRKVHKLVDFFTDHSVGSKYLLSEADLQMVRRTAAVDPGVAARYLQNQIVNKGFDCVVVPGDYAKGVRASRVRIHSALSNSKVSKPDVDLHFMGDNAYSEGPRDHSGRIGWTVKGPEKASPEVAAVARLALVHGVSTVRALFEDDLIRCGILLVEERGAVVGGVELHYGGCVSDSPAVAGTDGTLLPEEVRAAAARVVPLMEAGRAVATVVRLTEEVAYANWHVLNGASERRNVSLVMPSSPSVDIGILHEVAPDVWSVQHQAEPMLEGAWVHREADEAEACVLVYVVGKGVEFSDPVTVVRKENGSVVTTRPDQARRGMSGAALVALSDGALLGIYRGSSIDMCSCAVVAPTSHSVQGVSEGVVAAIKNDPTSFADSAYDRMVARGLHPMLKQALAAMKPVYANSRHVGYTVKYGSSTYTTLDCDVWTLTDVSGRPFAFERVAGDKFKAESGFGQAGLGFVRLPRIGESVYVMGNDDDGAYLTESMSVIKLASDNQSFWLSGDPAVGSEPGFVYTGAVLVAESDGAVLGQFAGALQTDAGVMSRCVGFVPRSLLVGNRREALLNSVVPGAMVELWEPECVAGMVERDEATVSRFAAIGHSAMQTAMMLVFNRTGVSADASAAVAVVGDSSWIGSRAYDCGFHQALRPASGVGGRPTERLADSFRAFIGMVATWQGADQVVQVLRDLGWFGFDWAEEIARLTAPARSPVFAQGPWGSRTSTPSPRHSGIF